MILRFATLGGILLAPSPALEAQTIRGTLMEVGTDRPVAAGQVVLLTESGDSVAATSTEDGGSFTLTAPEAGTFLLHASALGYRPRTAGFFELGAGGEMTVEFRLRPQPFPIEGLEVMGEAAAPERGLVTAGFYDRMDMGLGHFITPDDIRRAPPGHIEDLFLGIPNVVVRPGRVGMRSVGGGICDPRVFVDGMKVGISGRYGRGKTLDLYATRESLMGAEVYRRPAEIPLQYRGGESGASPADPASGCGVILLWTKG